MGSDEKKKDDKKKDEKKPVTVVLKVLFHCEQCVKRVKKAAATMDGVTSIEVDQKQGKLTIVGRVDPQKVAKKMRSKTGKYVELVQPKDKDGGDRKKDEKDGKKDDKKEDKKEKDDKEDKKKEEKKKEDKDLPYTITRVVHNDVTYVFSDDNPNSSCSIM